MSFLNNLLNLAHAEPDPTPTELIIGEVDTMADGLIEVIVGILPAIFTVVVVIVGLLVGYRLFRRMVSR